MGIGRFAFTPIFPLMQEQLGVTLDEGAGLATANYIGYLVGACASFTVAPKAGASAKWGLIVVALSTLAMGITSNLLTWFVLRLVAGVASAFVLVGASAWALAHLASHRRSDLAGWVFAGVGIGISLAGVIALAAGTLRRTPAQAWAALGIVALLIAAPHMGSAVDGDNGVESEEGTLVTRLDRSAWLLVACYGLFGFGYIIPATFIPAAARALVSDPMVFGWAWPVFGLAAAVSTIGVTTLFRATAPAKSAAMSLLVMAAGSCRARVDKSLGAVLISAVCVGGTFMVTTMAAFKKARRISTNPDRLIAALTAAFALGQLAGPMAVSLSLSAGLGLMLPGAAAAALLVCSALALLCSGDETISRKQPSTT
jgi:predicted MFS family arabinose efflux permease